MLKIRFLLFLVPIFSCVKNSKTCLVGWTFQLLVPTAPLPVNSARLFHDPSLLFPTIGSGSFGWLAQTQSGCAMLFPGKCKSKLSHARLSLLSAFAKVRMLSPSSCRRQLNLKLLATSSTAGENSFLSLCLDHQKFVSNRSVWMQWNILLYCANSYECRLCLKSSTTGHILQKSCYVCKFSRGR